MIDIYVKINWVHLSISMDTKEEKDIKQTRDCLSTYEQNQLISMMASDIYMLQKTVDSLERRLVRLTERLYKLENRRIKRKKTTDASLF